MSIRTATLNGVATIEIARPEKKNALTGAMYQAMADALDARAGRHRGARGADHRPAGHLHLGQRHRGLHAAPARRASESPAFAVHERADRLRQAGRSRPSPARRSASARPCCCTATSSTSPTRRGWRCRSSSLGLVPEFASSLIVPQLMGNARAAEKLLLGDPFTGADAVECGIANAVLPAGEVVNHARRVAERFNACRRARCARPSGCCARPQREAIAETIGVEGERLRARACAAPKRRRRSGLLPEAQARLLEVLSAGPGRRMSLALKLVLAPVLVAQAMRTRRRAPVLPEAAGAARRPRRAAAHGALRVLIAGDSSAAGVGVAHQDQALAGHLARALHARSGRPVAVGAARAHRPDDAAGARAAARERRRRRPTSRWSSPASTT